MLIGVCSAGLSDGAVASGERGGHFPDRHQQREVPGDDLTYDAQGLVEMVGDRVVVEFGRAALLGPDAAGEIAKMVDRQR